MQSVDAAFYAGHRAPAPRRRAGVNADLTASVQTIVAVLERHTGRTPDARSVATWLRSDLARMQRIYTLLDVAMRTPTRSTWWRTIAWLPHYEFGDQGEVRRTRRKAGGARAGTLVTQWRDTYNGYYYVKVWVPARNEHIRALVSRLICEAFHGRPRDPALQTCHNNGRQTDNRASNLRWDSARGNSADQIAHGTTLVGEKHPKARLTNDQVRTIRAELARDVAVPVLAQQYNVPRRIIQRIRSGQCWSKVV